MKNTAARMVVSGRSLVKVILCNTAVAVVLLALSILALWTEDCSAMRLTRDTEIQFCPSRPVLFQGGTTVTLDAENHVLSGVLARDTSLPYCSSASAVFKAGTKVSFASSPSEARCQVMRGTLAQDTSLAYSANPPILFKAGTEVIFRTTPQSLRCLVRKGTLARDTGLHVVGRVGDLTKIKAGTTVTFNTKGLAKPEGSGIDETPNATPIAAVAAAKNCRWESREYYLKGASGQDGGYFPLRQSPFRPGTYFVFVGPAGKDGMAVPPKRIKSFGSKQLKGGTNYTASMADRGETLRWRSDDPEVMRHSKPPRNEAVVLARNEADPAEWYALCLVPAGGVVPGVTDDERSSPHGTPLTVSVSPSQHTMKTGEQVITSAKVAGGVPPYRYQWFNNDKLSKVTKNSVRWTLRQGGSHAIKVVITDSQGKTAQAQAAVEVRTITEPPAKTPPTRTPPPVATPKEPTPQDKQAAFLNCLCRRCSTVNGYYNTGDSCSGARPCACWGPSGACWGDPIPSRPEWIRECYSSAYGVKNPGDKDLRDAAGVVKRENEKYASPKKPPAATPQTPPPPAPPKPPVTQPKPPQQQGGWHMEGGPKIEKNAGDMVNTQAYFGKTLSISDGSAGGSTSWHDVVYGKGGVAIEKCKGTYTGKVSWTKPPAYMKPGDKLTFQASSKTSANNTCGYRNIGSGVLVRGVNLYIDATDASPKPPVTYTVPKGSPGSKLVIEVFPRAAGLGGKVIYTYVYR
jgi:hypothetical protein